jgi:hypothetical protein
MGDSGNEARGREAAFYALQPGGWRDYWSLLHPPYTLWCLSYVGIGAATASVITMKWLWLSLAAFFLAVGISAHALDELQGRPLRTKIPSPVLWALAVAGLAGALAIGVYGATQIGWGLLAFMAFGAFAIPAYNLEWFGGVFHTDWWFAIAWGGFVALTGAFAQTGRVTAAAVAVAAGCALVSLAQRRLSTPVRRLRRQVSSVSGEIVLADGTREPIDVSALRTAPEGALRAMWVAMVLLAVGLIVARPHL